MDLIDDGHSESIQANGKFLIVMIDATNNGKQSKEIGKDISFIIFDELGREFETSRYAMLAKNSETRWKTGIMQPAWHLSDINPGLTLQNIPIIFDVPKDIQSAKFLPHDGIWNSKSHSITINFVGGINYEKK